MGAMWEICEVPQSQHPYRDQDQQSCQISFPCLPYKSCLFLKFWPPAMIPSVNRGSKSISKKHNFSEESNCTSFSQMAIIPLLSKFLVGKGSLMRPEIPSQTKPLATDKKHEYLMSKVQTCQICQTVEVFNLDSLLCVICEHPEE